MHGTGITILVTNKNCENCETLGLHFYSQRATNQNIKTDYEICLYKKFKK